MYEKIFNPYVKKIKNILLPVQKASKSLYLIRGYVYRNIINELYVGLKYIQERKIWHNNKKTALFNEKYWQKKLKKLKEELCFETITHE